MTTIVFSYFTCKNFEKIWAIIIFTKVIILTKQTIEITIDLVMIVKKNSQKIMDPSQKQIKSLLIILKILLY